MGDKLDMFPIECSPYWHVAFFRRLPRGFSFDLWLEWSFDNVNYIIVAFEIAALYTNHFCLDVSHLLSVWQQFLPIMADHCNLTVVPCVYSNKIHNFAFGYNLNYASYNYVLFIIENGERQPKSPCIQHNPEFHWFSISWLANLLYCLSIPISMFYCV